MKLPSVLFTLATGALLSLSALAADEAGFKSIFNAKDLAGWEGNPKLWSVKDGAITGITPPSEKDPKKGAITHNTFLVNKDLNTKDFELRLSYRIVNGNSGIQYRSKVLSQGEWGPIVGGYQADFEAGKKYSGILYEERGRGILAERGEKTVVKEVDGKKAVEITGSTGDKRLEAGEQQERQSGRRKRRAEDRHRERGDDGGERHPIQMARHGQRGETEAH